LRRSAAALAIAAATIAVGVASGSARGQDDGSDDEATDVVAGLVDASPYAPLSRRGRWDGTSLVPVAAGSIDTAQVVVITHGWEPGLREPYEQLQAASESLITAWDPQLVDSNGESAMIRFGPFIEALGRAEPEATILMFSWVDQSATAADLFDARVGEDATEINGHRLAVALDQAVADDWSGELHIIGHSFGASVATTAALAVDQRPRQLTLFDSPDDGLTRLGGAANDLRYKLPRLDLGREANQTFVDNYISEVGIRYGDLPGLGSVVDVRLSPPDELNFGQSHQYPIVWWTDAVAAGRSTPPAGPWWSPSLGGDPASVGAYYATEDAEDPLALTELDGVPSPAVGDDVLTRVVPLGLASGTELVVGGALPVVEAGFETTEDSLLLEFAVEYVSADGATLTLGVDGRERYTAVGPADGDGAPGAFVLLWDVEPGDHTLTAALTGTTDGTATLSNLRIVEISEIVRNATAEETDALTVLAIVFAAVVVIGLLLGVVLLVRALLRRRRR
jgi:hypothetical protein